MAFINLDYSFTSRILSSTKGKKVCLDRVDFLLTRVICLCRSKVWNSLRVLDILTSFIVGRPRNLVEALSRSSPIDRTYKSFVDHNSAFKAVLGCCEKIENIVQKLQSGNVLHSPTAESLLVDLRQWAQDLPTATRQCEMGYGVHLDPAGRQSVVGNVNVACVYYFAVMLITRPFMIAYLVSRLRGKAPDHLITDPEEGTDTSVKNNPVSRLCQVCVGSAVYMADLFHELRNAGFSFGTLGLIK